MNKQWFFTMTSDVFGTEEFGPYSSRRSAKEGGDRVKHSAKRLNDGIERVYSEPYTKKSDEQD